VYVERTEHAAASLGQADAVAPFEVSTALFFWFPKSHPLPALSVSRLGVVFQENWPKKRTLEVRWGHCIRCADASSCHQHPTRSLLLASSTVHDEHRMPMMKGTIVCTQSGLMPR
jgi:hypothetical protein